MNKNAQPKARGEKSSEHSIDVSRGGLIEVHARSVIQTVGVMLLSVLLWIARGIAGDVNDLKAEAKGIRIDLAAQSKGLEAAKERTVALEGRIDRLLAPQRPCD